MNRGKYICGQLKSIRRTIAKENNIPLEIPECTYEGECRGTCPRCEAEVQYLEKELARRAKLGITATVAAVAIAVAFQWIFNFIVSSTFVPMYNLEMGSMGSNFGHLLAYGLYGVMCVVTAIFVWKLVPETKGKTLEEMNNLWRK